MSREEEFAQNVLACVEELNGLIPLLARKYEQLVIAAALAEVVGCTLSIFRDAGLASPEHISRILRHISDTAQISASEVRPPLYLVVPRRRPS